MVRVKLLSAALALAAGGATAALAQTDPAPPSAPAATDDTIRLTDLQRMQILDSNTIDSAAAARGELTERQQAERGLHAIHGEVGVAIGSHGMRDVYGVADIPLGDTAHATVAVESTQFGYGRRR